MIRLPQNVVLNQFSVGIYEKTTLALTFHPNFSGFFAWWQALLVSGTSAQYRFVQKMYIIRNGFGLTKYSATV